MGWGSGMLLTGGFNKKKDDKPYSLPAAVHPRESGPATNWPAPVAAVSNYVPEVVGTVGPVVQMTGYCWNFKRQEWWVFLSDGRLLTTKDSKLTQLGDRGCVYDGKLILPCVTLTKLSN